MRVTSEEQVRRKIEGWQSALIDLTRRNPLYALAPKARGVLPIADPGLDELYTLLVRKRKALTFVQSLVDPDPLAEAKPSKAGNIALAELEYKILNNLRLRGVSALREQGINILFLAAGMLEWIDPDTKTPTRSPLLLIPVQLERLPGGDAFKLTRFEDEIELNPTLKYRLSQADLRIELPEPPDEEDLLPSAYLETVAALLPKRPDWRVTQEVVLGRFSFLKMVMYRDLVAHTEQARVHPIVAALAGDRDALTKLPPVDLPPVSQLDTSLRGERTYQVLDADPTQQRAILAAHAGQSFVLQGPPGTGKTQTIANIITECIADGKRVLFVSQKMAALDAVFKRLRDKGLADLCLEAHSHKANKKDVLDQLRRALTARRQTLSGAEFSVEELDEVRDALAEVVTALHDPQEPLGLSVYEANGIVAQASATVELPFAFIGPEQVSREQYRRLESLAERLQNYHSIFAEVATHPWRGIQAHRFTLDLQTRVRSVFGDLRPQIDLLASETAQLAGLCQIEAPQTINKADHLLRVANIAARTPKPPRAWLTGDSLPELRQIASGRQVRDAGYHSAKQSLLSAWTPALLNLDHPALLARLGPKNEPILRAALGAEWETTIAIRFAELDRALSEADDRIARLRGGLDGLAQITGRPAAITIGAARHEIRIAELALTDPRPETNWLDPAAASALHAQANEASAQHDAYLKNRQTLFAEYSDAVLGLDLPGLRARFASDYAGFLKFFKPAFYRDRKTVTLTLKPEAPRGRDFLRDLTLAQDVRDRGEWIRAHAADLSAAFGRYYKNLETDWTEVSGALRQTAEIVEACSGEVSPLLAQSLVRSGPALEPLRAQHQLLLAQSQELDKALQTLSVLVDLTRLPFTNLPLSQAPMDELADWLRGIRAATQDVHAARQETLTSLLPSMSSESLSPLHLGAALIEARRLVADAAQIAGEGAKLQAQYQDLYDGLNTDWNAVLAALDWTESLRAQYPGASIPEDLRDVVTEGPAPLLSEIAGSERATAARDAAIHALMGELGELFTVERLTAQSLPLTDAPFADLTTWLQMRLDRMGDLERWIDFQNLRKECEDNGLLSFFETATNRIPPADQIVPAFRKQFHRLWLDAVTDGIPAIRRFRGEEHAARIARFCHLDQRQIDVAPEGVRAIAQKRKPISMEGAVSSIGEMGALKTQLSRQRPKAIRKLLADIPNLLFLLKPCLLMSPLSVSLFLESETIWFDTVIFDEASQVFTEDAVGAILRAKQVIIAGDTKQLPPTSFFAGLQDDGAEEDDEDSGAAEFESVLKAADSFADPDSPHFAEHPLNWHYRSRHESLIAFSKIHFYKELIPYPSASLPSAVTFDFVADGVYYPGTGAGRNNPVEAARVVDLVIQHVRENPGQSIGVITFNEPQQTTILTEIERRKRELPDLIPLLSEEGSEGFFVKNIENVQGDERDVIFLSLGFGHAPSGKLSMNFGPLNQEGGERRLNVAVTRARRRMTVVASIQSGEIDLSRTDKLGPKLLKAYLEFAASGSQSGLSFEAHAVAAQSAFEQAIETALIRAGCQVRRQVGLFEYRVDLGIVDDTDPGRYLLGIECDGPMYRHAPGARARERLREQVLGTLGWRLLRVWSSDWVRDPQREMARITDAIARAKSGKWDPEATLPAPKIAEAEIDTGETMGTPGDDGVFSYNTSDTSPLNTNAVQETQAAYTTEGAVPFALPPGVEVFERRFTPMPGGRDTLYGDLPAQQKARVDFLVQLVDLEGPLPLETAAQHVAEMAGVARAGAKIREIVEDMAEALTLQDRIEQRDGFLWPRGGLRPTPRVPAANTPPRPIDEICLEEIGEAAIALLKIAYGMRRDELVIETARLLGYRNTGANIRDRIGDALSLLELDNRIHVVGTQIRALEMA
ncbi:MAG: helicase related protein [Capsulimonas sp.]|nr:helicase related protein [Capsulimonas sp.]